MQRVTARNVVIERCDGCGGEFYDACDLVTVSLSDGTRFFETLRIVAPASPASCPGCRTRMRAYEVGGQEPFVIDRCGKCRGVWLDVGEAERVRRVAARADVSPVAAGLVASGYASSAEGLLDLADGVSLAVDVADTLDVVDLCAGVVDLVGGLFS